MGFRTGQFWIEMIYRDVGGQAPRPSCIPPDSICGSQFAIGRNSGRPMTIPVRNPPRWMPAADLACRQAQVIHWLQLNSRFVNGFKGDFGVFPFEDSEVPFRS